MFLIQREKHTQQKPMCDAVYHTISKIEEVEIDDVEEELSKEPVFLYYTNYDAMIEAITNFPNSEYFQTCEINNDATKCLVCASGSSFASGNILPNSCASTGSSTCDSTCLLCKANNAASSCLICSSGNSFAANNLPPNSCTTSGATSCDYSCLTCGTNNDST